MDVIARALLALSAAALGGCGMFAGADPNERHTMSVTVAPVTDLPDRALGRRFGALTLTTARKLSSDDRAFGGVSALSAAADRDGALRLTLITDAADRIEGAVPAAAIADGEPHNVDAVIAPYRDAAGAPLEGKRDADSEGLAFLTGSGDEGRSCDLVSFERRHRVVAFCRAEDGSTDAAQAPFSVTEVPVAADDLLPNNGGLEALAMLRDGTLIAGGEAPTLSGAHPVWAWPGFDPSDTENAASGAAAPAFGVATPGVGFGLTGMDAGPDGTLYLLFRRWAPGVGNTIVIASANGRAVADALARAGDDADPKPVIAPRALTRLGPDGPLPVDNFEGISVDAARGGPTRLWIVSDDNFRGRQRTLLYGFTL